VGPFGTGEGVGGTAGGATKATDVGGAGCGDFGSEWGAEDGSTLGFGSGWATAAGASAGICQRPESPTSDGFGGSTGAMGFSGSGRRRDRNASSTCGFGGIWAELSRGGSIFSFSTNIGRKITTSATTTVAPINRLLSRSSIPALLVTETR
jgi:hypothetical protein